MERKSMSKYSIAFLAKRPELGKVKTRLAATIGHHNALEVYEFLLARTIRTLDACDAQVFTFLTGEGLIRLPHAFLKAEQIKGDLGERMLAAFMEMYEGKKRHKMLLVGADIPGLSQEIIQRAIDALDDHDVVLGPSEDGGYYLIGMTEPLAPLFIGKKWSHEDVLSDAIANAESLGRSVATIDTLNDIDTFEDLKSSLVWNEVQAFISH
ncbi:TIGR04282 family arsenosugar biosynthesis glycosyltransferase [Sanyastnella coralliicola]|uniref:TIGR04282 family arsenosugar biosynthesis glycosyltransferase n=1 Tax=Sanyastnella coralliicola TaxID=3069118 RepID=UPI0027B8B556|nr:TIGR04282 family arsenosugar biosynthesis glycosyltransferase [Longitalea sp. SCSIO 12813]